MELGDKIAEEGIRVASRDDGRRNNPDDSEPGEGFATHSTGLDSACQRPPGTPPAELAVSGRSGLYPGDVLGRCAALHPRTADDRRRDMGLCSVCGDEQSQAPTLSSGKTDCRPGPISSGQGVADMGSSTSGWVPTTTVSPIACQCPQCDQAASRSEQSVTNADWSEAGEDSGVAYHPSAARIALAVLAMVACGAIVIGWLYWVGME